MGFEVFLLESEFAMTLRTYIGLVGIMLVGLVPTTPMSSSESRFRAERAPMDTGATTTAGCVAQKLDLITGVVLGRSGNNVEVQWDATEDPCADGYRILGSTFLAPEGFMTLADIPLGTTSAVVDPAAVKFFIVVGKVGGNSGPWGHFGL